MSFHGWIGVDLDGTIAQYDHWRGAHHIGDPVPVMLDRVKRWLKDGKNVKIFTARVSGPEDVAIIAASYIHEWLRKVGLPPLEITCKKDYAMLELWDDRCVQVEINTGRRVGASHESDE